MKKQIIIVVSLAVCVLLGYLIARYLSERQQDKSQQTELDTIVTKRENIKDEILHYSDLEKLHADSAQFYHQKANASYKEYITVVADTSGWNSLRAAYTRNLEAKIRSGSTGLSDSLRVP